MKIHLHIVQLSFSYSRQPLHSICNLLKTEKTKIYICVPVTHTHVLCNFTTQVAQHSIPFLPQLRSNPLETQNSLLTIPQRPSKHQPHLCCFSKLVFLCQYWPIYYHFNIAARLIRLYAKADLAIICSTHCRVFLFYVTKTLQRSIGSASSAPCYISDLIP